MLQLYSVLNINWYIDKFCKIVALVVCSLHSYIIILSFLVLYQSDYENAAAYLNEDAHENSDTNEGPTVDSATEDCGGVD